MSIDQDIEKELHRIHRSRNRIGYFPNIISFLLSIYVQRHELLLDARWYFAALFVIVGTALRVVTSEVLFDKWDRGVKWVHYLHLSSFFFIGLGWTLHFSDVAFHFGFGSNNLIYTLLIIVAFIAGASTSLLANRDSYYVFVGTLSIGVMSVYVTGGDDKTFYIILNIILYSFFSIGNYRFSCRQLHDLLEMKMQSKMEKDRFKNLIDTVPGFVGLIDENLVCYMANQATLTVFNNIIGKKIGEMNNNSQWERHVTEFMASERTAEVFEEKTKFKGEDVHALLNIQKSRDGGAVIVSIITTELVEAKKNLRVQEAKAQYSAKLASLGEMAAGVAHEVNNPLTIIQGSANIINRLLDEEPVDKKNLKILTKKVMDTTDRISKTVKSLKSLSRNGDNDPKVEVYVDQIIGISVDLCHQKAKTAGIDLRFPNVIPKVIFMGREVQISQVLVNLLSNSMDAVKHLETKWIEIKVVADQMWVDILVIDSGEGIPKEIRARIMDPFFTTKDVNQGTGLGLSISKTIMSDHGGELSLLDREPHTTFRIRLPVKEILV